jgi:hypothetical protein
MNQMKSGIRHQSSMQKVMPGQAVSFVPQHTTRQRSNEPVMPFASPSSSSWRLSCLLMPLLFIPLKLHCVQQQRIQPLPVFWLACESATDCSSHTIQRKSKTATHCQSPSCFRFFLSGCGLNSQRLAERLWVVETLWQSEMPQKSSKKLTGKRWLLDSN